MRSCRRSLLVAAAMVAGVAADAPAQSWPWREVDRGRHAVGFRTIRDYDPSRSLVSVVDSSGTRRAVDRLIELRIWYPAAQSGESMRYRGYRDVDPADGPTGPLTDTLLLRIDGQLDRGAMNYVRDPTARERLLDLRTGAVRNAAPAAGPFPIILYSPGANDTSDENVVLWEYLASHGYVVAMVPSMGVSTINLSGAPGTLEMAARDMEWALARMRQMPFVDATRVATMGFSFGGSAAMVVAMRNTRVRAMVGLDPSFVFSERLTMLRASPWWSPATFEVPVLILSQRRERDPAAVLDSLVRAPRFAIRVGGLAHGEFTSYATAFRSITPAMFRDPGLRYRVDAFAGMTDYIRDFLDAYVRGEDARATGLRRKPEWRGVPSDSLSFTFQLGTAP